MVVERSDPASLREAPLRELLGRLAEDGTALLEAQIAMARAELARDIEGHVRRLQVVAVAMLLILCGLQLLVVALVLALATGLGGWLAALLVSVPFLLVGTTLLRSARSPVGGPFLEKTLQSLKEHRRWFRRLLH